MLKSIRGSDFLQKFNDYFTTVLFDCDGVLWTGGKLLPGSNEIFDILRQKDKRFYLVTNNSGYSRKMFLAHCEKLGLRGIDENNVVCTAHLAASYLKNTLKLKDRVFLIGTRGMVSELDAEGIKHTSIGPDIAAREGSRSEWLNDFLAEYAASNPPIGCVLVGFDEQLTYARMLRAAVCIHANPECHFVATNPDPTFPVGASYNGHRIEIPGTGSIVRAVATAACREPVILGKPYAPIFEHIQKLYEEGAGTPFDPSRTLFVGDRVETDVGFARKFGMPSLLLTTGGVSGQLDVSREAHAALEHAAPEARDGLLASVPDFHCESLADLVAAINSPQ